jgi:hypothetical protein
MGKPGGQVGNPGKTSRLEILQRVEFTEFCLQRGFKKWQIKAQLRSRYGLSGRSAERYIARAQERLIKATAKTREEHRRDAYRFYLSVIQGHDSTLWEKMRAQHLICKLFGLYAPVRVRHGGDAKAPRIREEVTVRELLVTSREEASASLAGLHRANGVKTNGTGGEH